MAGNAPTEKQVDTEYTANIYRTNLKGTEFRQGILRAKTEEYGEFRPAEDSLNDSN